MSKGAKKAVTSTQVVAKTKVRVVGRPFTGADDPRRNVTTPGSGRPPDEWKALCRELASRPEMLEKAREVLDEPNHPAWLGAWKFLAESGYGKPAQAVDVTTNGQAIQQVTVFGGLTIQF